MKFKCPYLAGLAAMPGDRVYPDGMIAQLSAAAKESSMRLLLKGTWKFLLCFYEQWCHLKTPEGQLMKVTSNQSRKCAINNFWPKNSAGLLG